MSNAITDWRQAVKSYLQQTFPDAEVYSGKHATVERNRTRIYIRWPGWPELTGRVTLATPTLTIRYFPGRPNQPSAGSPADPAPLEQAAADLMVAFAAKLKTGDFVPDLACRITDVTPYDDPDTWYVEATLRAYTLNLAAARP